MKLKLFPIIFLLCASVAWAQVDTNIDQTHRGYDIRANTTGARPVPPPRPFISPNVGADNVGAQSGTGSAGIADASESSRDAREGKYLISLGLGYVHMGDVEYGGSFTMPGSFLFSASFTAYLTQYFGLGAGLSYNNNTSNEENIGGGRAKFAYTTISPSIFLSGRLPMFIYDWLEPYANVGLAFHINDIEYTSNVAGVTTKRTTSGNDLGFFGELGARGYISDSFNAGLALRYTTNNQDVSGAGSVNMSNIMIMLSVGYLM
jgi:opacity protein-like surface antigen